MKRYSALARTFSRYCQRWCASGRNSVGGTTLAEAIISITLLGVVVIPMLFLSSAFFLGQLLKVRQSLDSTHSTSSFLNRFIEEMAIAQRILVSLNNTTGTGYSDSSQIYVAYFDTVAQKEYRIGYRLVADPAGSGNNILQRMEYDTTANVWNSTSPYGQVRASDVLLPSTAQFKYCESSACSGADDFTATGTASDRTKAVIVKLYNTASAGWSFTKGKQTFSLPVNTDIAVSVLAPNGGIMLSEQPKELYNFAIGSLTTNPTNWNRLNLSPNGQLMNYVDIGTGGAGGTGVLSTILPTTGAYIGVYSVGAASDGRVFFGQNANPGNFWTWKNNILSTILPSTVAYPGVYTTYVSPIDGRVFFATDVSTSSTVWTWYNNVLSTIINGSSYGYIMDTSAVFSPIDGRFFFGVGGPPTGGFWTWQNNILSTLVPTGTPEMADLCIGISPVDGRVFFGQDRNAAPFRTWLSSSGLSTITPVDVVDPGYMSTVISPLDGRVFFAQDQSSGSVWTWLPSTGLSTIVTGLSYPGEYAMKVNSSGRVFFGTDTTGAQMYTWYNNVLSTMLPSVVNYPGNTNAGISDTWYNQSPPNLPTYNSTSTAVSPADGRAFFGQSATSGQIWTWNNNILSTLLPAPINNPGDAAVAVASDGRFFFGQNTTGGNFYTWANNILSTLLPATINYSGYLSTWVAPDGRIFFGQGATGNVYTWKSGILSTLLPSTVAHPGDSSMVVAATGRVYFGQNALSGTNMYTWMASTSSTYGIIRLTPQGINTNQPLGWTVPGSPTYIASLQDSSGDFYLLDSTGLTVDRYSYNAGSGNYTQISKFTVGAWGVNVTAMAVDQAKTGIVLLDAVGKKLYIYADRTATGTPTPTSIDLTALTPTAPTTPTGLAINNRTGNYLVMDSATQATCQGVGGLNCKRLFVIQDTTATYKAMYNIRANDANFLSQDISADTSLRIQYDAQKNILYVVSPTNNKVYALSLPNYL